MRAHASRTTRRRQHGFSITELLVAISIIALIIGISFPIISALQRGGREEAGLNVVGMSVDVARQWVAPSAWQEDFNDAVSGESYDGTAALYCPTGEIRILVNLRTARAPAAAGNPSFLEERVGNMNGYTDRTGIDYISIPDLVGVLGVHRDSGNVRFLAPPFAVAFNADGQLSYGDINGRIYYDSDGNGEFRIGQARPAGYIPSVWTGEAGTNNEDVISATRPVRALPFEAIECVPGIVIYNTEDFENAGFNLSGGGAVALGSPAADWLQENGTTLFFSPHTGTVLRDEGEGQ